MRRTKLDYKYFAEDVLKMVKNIYKVDTGSDAGFRVSAISKKTKEIIDILGVDLLR